MRRGMSLCVERAQENMAVYPSNVGQLVSSSHPIKLIFLTMILPIVIWLIKLPEEQLFPSRPSPLECCAIPLHTWPNLRKPPFAFGEQIIQLRKRLSEYNTFILEPISTAHQGRKIHQQRVRFSRPTRPVIEKLKHPRMREHLSLGTRKGFPHNIRHMSLLSERNPIYASQFINPFRIKLNFPHVVETTDHLQISTPILKPAPGFTFVSPTSSLFTKTGISSFTSFGKNTKMVTIKFGPQFNLIGFEERKILPSPGPIGTCHCHYWSQQ